jgi:hypothetical protein
MPETAAPSLTAARADRAIGAAARADPSVPPAGMRAGRRSMSGAHAVADE